MARPLCNNNIALKQVQRFPGLRNWVAGSCCCITEVEKLSGAQNMQVTVSTWPVGRDSNMVTGKCLSPSFLASLKEDPLKIIKLKI